MAEAVIRPRSVHVPSVCPSADPVLVGCARDVSYISGRFGLNNARKMLITKCASFALHCAPLSSGRFGLRAGNSRAHMTERAVTTSAATDMTPAITHLILALCSAACKALRFASTALTRGLRALTLPARSSSIGNCVMAGRASGRIRTIRH
ncbi:MAG TPA: hypothetical protein VGJ78_23315 [Vicinamibacterales bacterium]|jgi:hypothetical protein